MTRWLAAAREAQARAPSDKTDKTDKTQPVIAEATQDAAAAPVLSVLSVLSERGRKPEPSPRAAIIAAMRGGRCTPGAIATAARLGATVTYQELDRMLAEGLLTKHPSGALALNLEPHP